MGPFMRFLGLFSLLLFVCTLFPTSSGVSEDICKVCERECRVRPGGIIARSDNMEFPPKRNRVDIKLCRHCTRFCAKSHNKPSRRLPYDYHLWGRSSIRRK